MKPIIVSVTSIQRDSEGEDAVVELVSPGKYYETARAKHIVYHESEVTGLEGTKTTIKVYEDSVVLLRSGQVSMRHEYRLGKTNESHVETPFGDIVLAMYTHELDIQITDGVGHVHLGYDISLDGEWQYYNQLHIEIREDSHYGNEGDFKTSD